MMAINLGPFQSMINMSAGNAFMIVRMAYDGTQRDALGMYPPVLWGTAGDNVDDTSDALNNPSRPTDLTVAEALKDTKDVHEYADFNFFRNYVDIDQLGEHVFWFFKVPPKKDGDWTLTADSSAWTINVDVRIKIWTAGAIVRAIAESPTPITLETVGDYQEYMTNASSGKMDYAASFPGFVGPGDDHRIGYIDITYPPPDKLRTLTVLDTNFEEWPP